MRDKVHMRLRIRLVIYFVISIIVLGISIFHIVNEHASIGLSVVGLLAGVIIGILASRILKITWDAGASQVVSRFDTIGITILVAYIIFEVNRERIVGQFVSDTSVVSVSFAVLAGLMYGRVLGIRGKIRKIFKEEGVV